MSKLMKGRAITIGAVGMALLASAAACFLLSQWPKVYSSPTDLDITTNTTWTGDQIIYGTLTVKAGKTLTIDSSAAGSAPITITATNLIVESTAAITANGKGSAGGAATSDGAGTGKGLAGSASKSGGGAGYGGAGGDGAGNAGSGGAAYGDNSLPINNGSGGGGGASTAGGAGGGAIKFIVSGTTTLNGPVSVNGADGTGDTNGSGGGSGGSIYLDTNVLTGSGNISANGGSAVNGSGGAGGGGRVAVYYNSNSGYSGTVSTDKGATGSGTAAGGTTLPGGLFTGGTSGTGPMGVFPNGLFTGGTSGTGPMGIGYYSASSTAFVWSGEGSDNSDSTVANWQGGVVPTTAGSVIFCELSSKNCTWDITASMLDFTLDSGYTGTVTLASTLTTTSAFTLTQGAFNAATYNLTVGGNFTRSGLASFTPGTSTVILNSVGTSSVYGDNTFYNLTSTAAGKTINFEATKTVTVTNNLSLAGTGTGVNLLTLNSTTAGTAANLNVAGTATGMNYLSVKDSNVSGKTIVAYNSTNVSGNTNWIFGSAGTVYWTNSSGNGLWSNAANWSTGAVPISTDSVIFNTASTTNCSFDTGVANTTVANLTLDTGYTGTLTLAQGIIVSGTITINAGTINDGGQTVNLTNMAYTAGTITSSGTWKAVANGTISSWGSSGVNNFEVATGKNSAIANSITMRIKNQVVQRGNSIITIGSGSYLWYISAAATDPIYQESGATVSGGTINFGGITSAISQRAFTTTGDFAVSQTTATFTATGAWDIGGKFYNSTNSTYTAAFNFGANTIKVAGDFDLRGMALNPGTSTLQITGANSLTSNMYAITSGTGVNTIPLYNLTSTVAGKTIKIEAAKTLTVAGNMTLQGASGSLLNFQSGTASTAFTVDLTNGYAVGMNYLNVIDSNATAKNIVVNNSTLTRTTNWISAAANIVYWINGSGDNKWSTDANWSTGVKPTSTNNVYFSPAFTSNCTVDQSVTIAGLITQSGYNGTINFGNNTISIAGDCDLRYATIDLGTAVINITADNATFNYPTDLTLSSNNGLNMTGAAGQTVVIPGSFTVASGATFTPGTSKVKFTATSGTKIIDMVYDSGSPLVNKFYNLTFDGVGGSWQYNPSSSSVLQVANDLTVVNGTFDNNTTPKNINIGRNLVASGATARAINFGNAVTWNITGSADLSGANLSANFNSNSTINVGGDWNSSGTNSFTVGTSTVNLTGSGKLNAPIGVDAFYKLTCAASTKTTTIDTAIEPYIKNTLTLGGGNLTQSGSNSAVLTLNSVLAVPLVFNSPTLSGTIKFKFMPSAAATVTIPSGTYGTNITIDVYAKASGIIFQLGGDIISLAGMNMYADPTGIATTVNFSNKNLSSIGFIKFGDVTNNGAVTLNAGNSAITFNSNTGLTAANNGGNSHILNMDNSTWTVLKDWKLTQGTGAITMNAGASSVILSGTNSATIYGDNSFYNLTCTTAGKQLSFQDNKTQTITNKLILVGSQASPLYLDHFAGTTDPWKITIPSPGGATATVAYVSVYNSYASGGKQIVASGSTDGGGNTNWSFTESGIAKWTGNGGDNQWSTAGNWSLFAVPTADNDVVFDATSTANCNVNSAAVAKSVTLNTGYSGTVTLGANLTTGAGGFIINQGTFAPATYTLIVGGGPIKTNSNALYNLTINGGANILQDDLILNGSIILSSGTFNTNSKKVTLSGAATAAITGAVTFYDLICSQAGKTISFENGKLQTITHQFAITGASGNRIKLVSASAGNQWFINVPTVGASVMLAEVGDSSSTNQINTVRSENKGNNNSNWKFVPTRAWDGGGSTNNWSEAANWEDDKLPGADGTPEAPVFNNTSTKNCVVDIPVSVTDFIIDAGYSGTVSIGASGSITSTGTIVFNSGTTGTLNDSGRPVSFVNMDIEGGTLTSTGKWTQTASGEIRYSSPSASNKIGTLAIAGAGFITTLASDLHVNAIEFGAGTLNGAGKNLHIHGNSDFIATASTPFTVGANSKLATLKIYDCYAQGAFVLPDSLLASGVYIDWLYRTSGASASGAWNFGNNKVRFTNNGTGSGTMNLSSSGITAGDVQVGATEAADNNTIINFGSGAHTINSLSKAYAEAISGTPLRLLLGSGSIACSGALDFTGISVDEGSSILNLTGATQTITTFANADTFNTVNFSGNGPFAIAGNFKASNAVISGAQSVNCSGSFNITTAFTLGTPTVPGTPTVTLNGVTSGLQISLPTGSSFYNLTLDGAGAAGWTLASALSVSNNFTITKGALTDNGKAVSFRNLSIADVSGILPSSTSTWTQSASGTISCPNKDKDNCINILSICGAGIMTTFNGDVAAKTVSFGTGALAGALKNLYLYGNINSIVCPAVFTVSSSKLANIYTENHYSQAAFKLPNDLLSSSGYIYWRADSAANDLTASGVWDFGNNRVAFYSTSEAAAAGKVIKLTNLALTCGDLMLGNPNDATAPVTLSLNGGIHTVSAIGKANSGTVAANLLNFSAGNSTINCSGDINFTGITFTPGASSVSLQGGTTAVKTITSSGQAFNILSFNDSNMTWKLNDTLSVYSDLSLIGNFQHNNQKVIISSPTQNVAKITGGFTFYDLECATAGKTLSFSSARTQTVQRNLTITGQSGTPINLYSQTTGQQWSIDADAFKSNVSNVNVRDSNVYASKTMVATGASIDVNNNTGWIIGGKFTFETPTINSSFKVGNPAALSWITDSRITQANLYYTPNASATPPGWTLITIDPINVASNHAETTYTWASVPDSISSDCKIKIAAVINGVEYSSLNALSDTFKIVGGLTLTYPTEEGIGWPVTMPRDIRWSTGGNISQVNIYYSTDVGVGDTWHLINHDLIGNPGTYSWNPSDALGASFQSITCRIKIEDASNSSVNSASSNNFIISTGGLSDVTLKLSGSSKDTLISGLTYQINWVAAGTIASVNLDYLIDNGSPKSIAAGVSNSTGSNFYNWVIPHDLSDNVAVRVSNAALPAVLAKAQVKIVAPFTITAPAAGNIWLGGSASTISWQKALGSEVSDVKIEYTTDANTTNPPGPTWTEINGGVYTTVNDLSKSWSVPALPANFAQVRIKDAAIGASVFAYATSGVFKIKAGNLAVVSPNTQVAWKVGELHQIQWTKSGDVSTVNLFYCTDAAGTTWKPVATGVAASLLQYAWTVPDDISDTCKIKVVSGNDSEIFDISDVNFLIKPNIILNTPNGGQSWIAGKAYSIEWSTNGTVSAFVPRYTVNANSDPVVWNNVIITGDHSTTNAGNYTWIVPDTAISDNCLVRVQSAADSTAYGESAAKFAVILPTLTVSSPKAGDIWVKGDLSKEIKWSSVGTIHSNSLAIEYSALGDFSDAVTIASNQGNSGTYLWDIPNDGTIAASIPPKTAIAKIRITDVGWSPKVVQGISVPFEMTAPRINVTLPAAGDRIAINTNFDIKWVALGSGISTVKILYSPTGDFTTVGAYYTVASGFNASAGSYTYNWSTMSTIPLNTATSAKFRIVDASNETIYGDSGAFRVAGTFVLTAPAPATTLFVGKPVSVSWLAVGNMSQVKLSYSKNGNGADAVWYNMEGGSASGAPTLADNSSGTGTYNWTVPDIVLLTHDPNTNVYIKLEDPNDPLVFDAIQLTVSYYQVKWKVIDEKNLVGDLAALVVESVDVTATTQNFEQTSGLASGVILYYYPNKKYNTVWSRDAFLETMVSNWEAYADGKVRLSDGTIINTLDSTDPNYGRWVIKMPQKLITKVLTVQSSYYFDPDSDSLSITGWLMQQDTMIAKYDSSIGVPGVTEGFADVYDDANNLVSSSTTAFSAVLNNNGTFNVIWKGLRANGKLVVGKNYFVRVRLMYLGAGYIWGGLSFQITSAVNIQGIQQGLGLQPGQTVVGQLKQTLGVSGVGAETIAAKVQIVTDKALSILTAAEKTIPDKITQMGNTVTTSIKTEIKPNVQSGILTRDTTVKQGDTMDISYRTATGLTPTITIYDSKDKVRLDAKPMVEIGTSGVYVYKVKFLASWGKGDFTVVCTEPINGTADALTMTVIQSNLEDVSGQVSAVLGSTTGISGLKNVADTLNTQFNVIDSTLAKLSANIVGKVTETKDALGSLQTVFTQLEAISKQIKGIGGTAEGINLEKLYNVSKDKQNDVTYIKNKTQELKAAMDINQKLMQNVANKPVVQTWFEFK